MNSRISSALAVAYRSTAYVTATPNGPITIRIGSASTGLDELLTETRTVKWAYLSASNPGSHKLSPAENARRFAKLVDLLQKREKVFFEGYSRADDGAWPDEASALVLGIGLSEALGIGRKFGQLAIVTGIMGGQAALIDCRTGEPI